MAPSKLPLMLLLLGTLALAPATGQSGNAESSLVGDWHGESICQVRESACHDEDSLYHVEQLDGKPHWISIFGL